MDNYTKRYIWCERTEHEYLDIKAEIEKRRAEMLPLDDQEGLNWPARNRELEDWLVRGQEFIDSYREGMDESWKNICDYAQQGWNDLKKEVHNLLDDIPG